MGGGDHELPFFHQMLEAAARKKWKRLLMWIALLALLIFGLWFGVRMGWLNQAAPTPSIIHNP